MVSDPPLPVAALPPAPLGAPLTSIDPTTERSPVGEVTDSDRVAPLPPEPSAVAEMPEEFTVRLSPAASKMLPALPETDPGEPALPPLAPRENCPAPVPIARLLPSPVASMTIEPAPALLVAPAELTLMDSAVVALALLKAEPLTVIVPP